MQHLRRRLKQLKSLEERLAEDAKRLRDEAKLLPLGAVRNGSSARRGRPRPARKLAFLCPVTVATFVSSQLIGRSRCGML
jgi:hypothetical protein